MNSSGLGTPYWYEWEIGLISCLDMLYEDNIESVVLQSSLYHSLDDVVVNYRDHSSLNIQVKHTDIKDHFTFSMLLNGTDNKDPMLKAWATEWKQTKDKYNIQEIRIATNREWGPNRSVQGEVCSFKDFVEKALPKWKLNYNYLEPDNVSSDPAKHKEYIYEFNGIKKVKDVLDSVLGTDAEEFIKLLNFVQEPSKEDVEKNIQERVTKILGTDRSEPIEAALNSLYAKLRVWSTSSREKPEITKINVYETLCVEMPTPEIPKYDLYPEKPIFPSRLAFGREFIRAITFCSQKFVFLEGVPGCGKTNFISFLANQLDSIVDFRFYTYLPPKPDSIYFSDEAGYYSSDYLWGSILTQLRNKFSELHLLYDVNFPLIYSFMSILEKRATALKFLPIYAEKVKKPIYLFIDGLDHAARCKDFRSTFLQQLPSPDEIGDNIKFVLVGQPLYDLYPMWLQKNNDTVLFLEMPLLSKDDVMQIIKQENIQIANFDTSRLSEDIIDIVGNNTLNIVYAVKEISRGSVTATYDTALQQLKERNLNGDISRYYEWILGNTASCGISDLLVTKLKIIFAFASSKIEIKKIAYMCEADYMETMHALHKLTPLITISGEKCCVFHNDFRLFLREQVGLLSDFPKLSLCLYRRIQEEESLKEYKYTILFSLLSYSENIDLLCELFTPQYIIDSIQFDVPLVEIYSQFRTVTEIIRFKNSYDRIPNLALECSTISQYVSSVNYNCLEDVTQLRIPTTDRTDCEKYMLDAHKDINTIVLDIYFLARFRFLDRGRLAYKEYFDTFTLGDFLKYLDPTKKYDQEIIDLDIERHSIYEKAGYICRFFNEDIFKTSSIRDSEHKADFTGGWLRAAQSFLSLDDIRKTFTFDSYYEETLLDYLSSISSDKQAVESAYTCMVAGKKDRMPLQVEILLCSEALLHGLNVDQLRAVLLAQKNEILTYANPDEITYGPIEYFFRLMFCIYEKEPEIMKFKGNYTEILKTKRIIAGSRGYAPAKELFNLAEKTFSIFYNGIDEICDIEDIINRLAFISRKYGAGSVYDCDMHPVRQFLYRTIVAIIENNKSCDLKHICLYLKDLFNIGKLYFNALVPIFLISNEKNFYIEIADFWAGKNGIVWKESYDVVTSICKSIEQTLRQFGEETKANEVAYRRKIRVVSYVDHKDYSLYDLLSWYQIIPLNEQKLLEYGLDLLNISDRADEIGDNRIGTMVDREVFTTAIELGPKYIDALFEFKNNCSDFYYWRQSLMEAFREYLPNSSMSNSELFALYKLVNAWTNPAIEESDHYRENEIIALKQYNYLIWSMISDPDLKNQISNGGYCEAHIVETPEDKKRSQMLELISNYLDKNGSDKNFQEKFLVSILNPNFRDTTLLIKVTQYLQDAEKPSYVSSCIVPYIAAHNEYGYSHTGVKELIRNFYCYFSKDNWKMIIDKVLSDILEASPEDIYDANRDLELVNLYYVLANHPETIATRFEERLEMHWTWITENGTLERSKYNLCFDPNVNSIEKFAYKQIG